METSEERVLSPMEQRLAMSGLDLREVRSRIRDNEYEGPTAGLAPGFAQANPG